MKKLILILLAGTCLIGTGSYLMFHKAAKATTRFPHKGKKIFLDSFDTQAQLLCSIENGDTIYRSWRRADSQRMAFWGTDLIQISLPDCNKNVVNIITRGDSIWYYDSVYDLRSVQTDIQLAEIAPGRGVIHRGELWATSWGQTDSIIKDYWRYPHSAGFFALRYKNVWTKRIDIIETTKDSIPFYDSLYQFHADKFFK